MMTNLRDGIVKTDQGDVLSKPNMTVEQLLSVAAESDISARRTDSENRPRYKRFNVGPVAMNGFECVLDEYFTDDVITEVVIVLSESTAEQLGIETGYGAPRDGEAVTLFRKWVSKEVGSSPQPFRWGRVGHIVGDFPGIVVKYNL